MRRSLAWSPVHTEKFWQTQFIYFNERENLECIDILISILEQRPTATVDAQALDTMKAVACYDLGEFARFFPLGKTYLEERSAKTLIADLMGSQTSSAELKKEAITAYQKLLMKSWGQGGF
jgi:V-type H+-transporting ATPase subunit H